jgi:RNA polymerase sigma factor (sigma-70 family)
MTEARTPRGPAPAWDDDRLVQACLAGKEEAWSALVDKYKRLIYSIPIRYGLSPEDAGDVFQHVCVTLLSELHKLKDPKSLPAWLIRVTSHRCFHVIRESRKTKPLEEFEMQRGAAPDESDHLVLLLEREQLLHEAMADVPARCRELLHMLFFETPAVPYDEVAKALRLARGSIGFIRMRCLRKLRLLLIEKGFR